MLLIISTKSTLSFLLLTSCRIMIVAHCLRVQNIESYQDHQEHDQEQESKNTEGEFQEILRRFDERLHDRNMNRNNKYSNQSSIGWSNLDHRIIPCLLSQDPISLSKFKLNLLYFRIEPNKYNARADRQPRPDRIFSNDYSLNDLVSANIDLNIPTKIITHGFNDGWPGFDDWLKVIAEISSRRATRKSNLFFFTWKAPEVIQQYNYFTRYGKIVNNVKSLGYYLGEFIVNLAKSSSADRSLASKDFDSFELMGHSLGAHILGLSARYVLMESGKKIGRIVALDPAYPCFNKMKDTIDSADVRLLVTTHTNAGLQGSPSRASNLDIFVNGGTLQPGCHYDSTCSHGLARLLYNHVDEQCQMVAYKCRSYDQFKLGACSACDGSIDNHILVNAQEQSFSQENDAILPPIPRNSGRLLFVDTNPIQLANDTLCLQHYQIRLLIATGEDSYGLKKCRSTLRQFLRRHIMVFLSGDDGEPAKAVRLNSIIPGQLYTGLMTVAGRPKRFNYGLMPDTRQPVTRANQDCFILADIAFMGGTQQATRKKYSSILIDRILPHADQDSRITTLTEVKPSDFQLASGTDDTCQTISGLIDRMIMTRGGQFNRQIYEVSLLSKVISFLLFIVPK